MKDLSSLNRNFSIELPSLSLRRQHEKWGLSADRLISGSFSGYALKSFWVGGDASLRFFFVSSKGCVETYKWAVKVKMAGHQNSLSVFSFDHSINQIRCVRSLPCLDQSWMDMMWFAWYKRIVVESLKIDQKQATRVNTPSLHVRTCFIAFVCLFSSPYGSFMIIPSMYYNCTYLVF